MESFSQVGIETRPWVTAMGLPSMRFNKPR
jgi:hypothetical protein